MVWACWAGQIKSAWRVFFVTSLTRTDTQTYGKEKEKTERGELRTKQEAKLRSVGLLQLQSKKKSSYAMYSISKGSSAIVQKTKRGKREIEIKRAEIFVQNIRFSAKQHSLKKGFNFSDNFGYASKGDCVRQNWWKNKTSLMSDSRASLLFFNNDSWISIRISYACSSITFKMFVRCFC